MNNTFDDRKYRGKDRIYVPVPKKTGILRLYVWNGKRYADPKNGKKYDVRRTIIEVNGKRRRVKQMFSDLSEAILWQQGEDSGAKTGDAFGSLEELAKRSSKLGGMTFGNLVNKNKKNHVETLASSTQKRYERIMDRNLPILYPILMDEFKPQVIDEWLNKLISSERDIRRESYEHEFEMLVTILRFYEEYFDEDANFISPIKKRHKKKALLGKTSVKITPELTEDEFYLFREKLMYTANGGVFAIMATLQYFQALRISEAAAVYGTDFQIDQNNRPKSRFVCSRGLKWTKDTGKPTCEGGLKNGQYIGGFKEQPLLPESFTALSLIPDFWKIDRPLFQTPKGDWFTYRQIQRAYDKAFVMADLSYTGTHIMRHGGCRALYNQTGDLAVAKQHLGNKNMNSVLVYAQRRASALSEVVSKRWGNYEVVSGTK